MRTGLDLGFCDAVAEEWGLGPGSVRCYRFGMEEGWEVGIGDPGGEGGPSQPVSLSTLIPR